MSTYGFLSGWNAVYLGVLFATPSRKLYRGKILTMPFRRRIRYFQPRSIGARDGRGFCFRLLQLPVAAAVLTIFSLNGAWNMVPWLWCIALYLDDYLTGDDERWKRFKDWAGNKVKWRMELPVPARQETA